jgi:8-oxo-dGTP pyrophosphatase MutT (NUDIX family)
MHPDGRYLLVRRAVGVSAGGYWTPVTGKIERGESLEDAAVREVEEEVGLWVGFGREVFRCPTHPSIWMLVWHEAPLLGPGTITVKQDELAEARWVSAAQAVELEPMFPATRAFYAQRAKEEVDGC